VNGSAHGSGSGPPLEPFPPDVPTEPDTRPDSLRARARTRAPVRGELVVRTGPVAGLRFVLREGTIVVGRSSRCDLPLHDPAVSRTHFELRVTSDGVSLRDLGSGNGTRVEGRRVEEVELLNGNRILAGNSTLEFRESPSGAETSSGALDGGPGPEARKRGVKALAMGASGLAVVLLGVALTLHHRHVQRGIARRAIDRGMAELAKEPPEPELALADFLSAEHDAPDRHALASAVATAQDEIRAMQQLGRARELSDRGQFADARRELQGLLAGAYFDHAGQTMEREIDEREAVWATAPRPATPVIRSLPKTGAPGPARAAPAIRRRSSSPKTPVAAAAQPDDERAEQLCDEADALLGRDPGAAKRKYQQALQLARPGGPAARRAQGGLAN